MINADFLAAKVRTAFAPAQETLFDLLRGIRKEQRETNVLLTMLLTTQTIAHGMPAKVLLDLRESYTSPTEE